MWYEMIKVISGGMGVYISNPFLTRILSMNGILGTVSGVAADKMMSRILQNGDPGEHFRRALAHFPLQAAVKQVFDEYFVPGGIPKGTQYKSTPATTLKPSILAINLLVCANFAFIWLAKEGHENPVSINYLEKMQLPLIFSIFGAMLAGVDCISIGAGIALQVPSVIDSFSKWEEANYRISVEGGENVSIETSLNPKLYFNSKPFELKRPKFLPIVSSDFLASLFLRKNREGVDGFVVEGPTAGGHNAPPRGKMVLDQKGEPIYGVRDEVNFAKMRNLGLPFWLGGSCASPKALKKALGVGANGIQVGSIFALCEESGMDLKIKREIRKLGFRGELQVKTDVNASPTGFPFKVADLKGTLSEDVVYRSRKRICDLAGLSIPYLLPNGSIQFLCPAERIADYIRKGGKLENTQGSRCICNGLTATAGLGNLGEPPIVTLGDDVSFLPHLMKEECSSYTAKEAIDYLVSLSV